MQNRNPEFLHRKDLKNAEVFGMGSEGICGVGMRERVGFGAGEKGRSVLPQRGKGAEGAEFLLVVGTLRRSDNGTMRFGDGDEVGDVF